MQPSSLIPEHFQHLKRNFVLISNQSHPISSLPLGPNNHSSTLYLCGFACFGHVIHMESNSTWSFLSGFFHWAWCIPDSSVLWFVAVLHSFLWLNNTPLYTYTTFHLSVTVSLFNDGFTLGLLRTLLLKKKKEQCCCTFMYKILHRHVNSFICHIYLVELWVIQ